MASSDHLFLDNLGQPAVFGDYKRGHPVFFGDDLFIETKLIQIIRMKRFRNRVERYSNDGERHVLHPRSNVPAGSPLAAMGGPGGKY